MDNIELALRHEIKGLKSYERYFEIYGKDIFAQIAQIKATGIEMLKALRPDFECEIEPIYTGKSYHDALVLALGYEIKTGEFYDKLTDNTEDENLRDLLFRLWATSQNEYKKALNAEMKKQNLSNNGNLGEILQKFANGDLQIKDFLDFLGNPKISGENFAKFVEILGKNFLNKGE